jgi:DNA-binding transcriptional LysR family regulator
MISITGLRAFWKVATLGSFRAAADDLNVSQPVLSRQVKDLEVRYGVVLLKRTGSGSTVTAAGCQLLERASDVFSLLHQTDTFLRSYQASSIKFQAVSHVTVPRIISTLSEHFGVSFDVSMAPSRQIEANLDEASCDLGLLTLDDESTSLERHLLGRYDMLSVVPPNHRLAGKKRLTIRDLDRVPIVIGTPMTQTRRFFERHAETAGVRTNVVFEVNCRHTLSRFAHEMNAVGIFSDTGFSRKSFQNTKSFTDPVMRIPVYIATHRDHPKNSLPDKAFQYLGKMIDRAELL